MILITDRKFFKQWDNGDTHSSNTTNFAKSLDGSVSEVIKLESTVFVTQETIGTQDNPYYIECDSNGLYNILRRDSGSWIQDGYQIGDTIKEVYYYNGLPSPPTLSFSDTIVSVSDLIMTVTNTHPTHAGMRPNNAVIGVNRPVYLKLNFGLPENSDQSLNFLSPFSNDTQAYYYDAISGTPTTHDMVVFGGINANKNWQSLGATVKYESAADPLSLGTNYQFKFTITHTFRITPFYIDEFLDNYTDNTLPENYIGNKSLKYIAEYEFRTVASNSNTDIVGRDNFLTGEVKWLDETNTYTVAINSCKDSLTGEDVDSLQSSRKTTIIGTVTGSGFTNASRLGLYFWNCSPSSKYQVNQGSLDDAFLIDSKILTMSGGTVSATPSGRIKRFKVDYVDATHLTFEADIELSSDEKTYVGTDNYFVGIQAGNKSSTTLPSVTSILTLDYQPWTVNNDVAGLATFSNQQIYPHNIDESNPGHTDYKGWKGDGVLFKSKLTLDKTLDATLQALRVRLVAYNSTTGNLFELQSYNFNLSDIVSINAAVKYQQLSIDTTRGFKLKSGDQFNNVILNMGIPSGGLQVIDYEIGLKLDWQSWIKLDGADTIFYDSAKDSNGMGLDASRYSLNEGYAIKIISEADINQLSTAYTTYRDISPDFTIMDWDDDGNGPALWSVLIETFDLLLNDLNGAIQLNADTVFRTTFTPLSGDTTGWSNAWAIHRIDKKNSSGYNGINELSSLRLPPSNNILKPVSGETLLKITDNTTDIVTECLIDYTKLDGNSYTLQSRFGKDKTYGRYQYCLDFKFLDDAKTEAVLFSYGGFPGETFSCRHAVLDAGYNVVSERRIVLNTSYDYEFMKIAVAYNEIVNGKCSFYMIGFGGSSDTSISRFVFDGTDYQQTVIHTEAQTGSSIVTIKVDPNLLSNGRAFVWFGNLQMDINTGSFGFKTIYWNGASYVVTDVDMYNAGDSHTFLNPIDIAFNGTEVYIQNFDQGVATVSGDQEKGKIGYWIQTSGSIGNPTDRSTFSNYTYQYDLYKTNNAHENTDGIGTVGDMAGGRGIEITGLDANNKPIFMSCAQSVNGYRHFMRIRANISTPTTSAHWTIETPIGSLNALNGAVSVLSGTASSSAYSSLIPYRYTNNLGIVDNNTFITGNADFFFTKWTINSWTGASNNDWVINAPNDPAFDFTDGNILTE